MRFLEVRRVASPRLTFALNLGLSFVAELCFASLALLGFALLVAALPCLAVVCFTERKFLALLSLA